MVFNEMYIHSHDLCCELGYVKNIGWWLDSWKFFLAMNENRELLLTLIDPSGNTMRIKKLKNNQIVTEQGESVVIKKDPNGINISINTKISIVS